MSVAFKSATSAGAFTPASASITITKPGAVVSGDTMVGIMFSTGGPLTPPAGWAQIGAEGITPGVSLGRAWYKVAGAAEPGTYDWGMSAADSAVLFLVAFTGARTGGPIESLTWGGSGTPATAQVAPSEAPTALGAMMLSAWAATGGGLSWLPPAGMTECGDATTAWQGGATAYEARPSTGATGTRTATCVSSTGYLSVSITLVPANDADSDEATVWIDASGGMTELDVEWDTQGRFAPPNQFEEDEVPEQAGSQVRAVRHKPRDTVLALWIDAASGAALRTALRELVAKMDPIRGDGKMRVTSPLGDQRELTCRYRSGLELVERLGQTSGPRVQRAPVMFHAADPYWYAINDEVATYGIGSGTSSWFPFFPLRLGTSSLFTDATVVNGGDVECWPVWEITGPGSAINLRNLTTGKLLTLNTTLVGETATIDTRFGAKTVVRNDNVNLFGSMPDASELWPLQRGSNSIRVEISGATTATSVRLSWKPRYLTA